MWTICLHFLYPSSNIMVYQSVCKIVKYIPTTPICIDIFCVLVRFCFDLAMSLRLSVLLHVKSTSRSCDVTLSVRLYTNKSIWLPSVEITPIYLGSLSVQLYVESTSRSCVIICLYVCLSVRLYAFQST